MQWERIPEAGRYHEIPGRPSADLGAKCQGPVEEAEGFAASAGGVLARSLPAAPDGERLVLRHLATDRAIFARGALKAGLWGQGKKPGEYDMMDALGL